MRARVLLVTAILLAPAAAAAQPSLGCVRPATLAAPFAFVSVNGQCANLSAFIAAQAKGWSLNTRVGVGGAVIDLSAVFDPDPGITFSGTSVNPSLTATTYAFLFGTAITPDMYSLAVASVQFTATSPAGTTTVANSTTYPTFLSGYGSVGSTLTNLGVDAGTTPCVASGVAASHTCDAEFGLVEFAPTFYDNLEALVTYTQDNTLSTATFRGSVTLAVDAVTTAPEPTTLALLGSGLFLLAGGVRRRSGRRVA